jgi:hypothetical protein
MQKRKLAGMRLGVHVFDLHARHLEAVLAFCVLQLLMCKYATKAIVENNTTTLENSDEGLDCLDGAFGRNASQPIASYRP